VSDQAELDAATHDPAWRPGLRDPISSVGTSQLAKYRVALGLRTWQLGDPDYIRRQTAIIKKSGQSRALLNAAGVLKPLSEDNETLNRGSEREPQIFAAWKALLEGGYFAHDFEAQINPATIVWRPPPRADDPRMHDAECPELSTSGFDGDALTYDGEPVAIDAKCARYKHPHARFAGPVWWDRGVCPWWYADQLGAIMSMRRMHHSLLIVGGGWNRDDDDPRSDGPLRVFYVKRDERHIEEVREIARRTMRRVRDLRATAAKAA
jgi:hypothetical protein